MSTTFEFACVGDDVWDIQHGWGTVYAVKPSDDFPIKVTFDNFDESYSYSGQAWAWVGSRTLSQTLFWGEVIIVAPVKPLPDLPVDTKVLVWDVDKPKNKLVRYFCSFDASGRVVVFQHGTTSFSCEGYTEIWSEWEVYKEHESE